LILDVGCGVNPRGDVNLDFKFGGDYGTQRTKADVIGDVTNLNYQDDSFDIVHFNGLLHHIKDPRRAWLEIERVASKMIIGLEPNLNLTLFHMIPYLDPTESVRIYRRKTIGEITRSQKFDVVIERVVRHVFPPRTEWRIVAYRHRYQNMKQIPQSTEGS
jgi:ubiquinone/menaquinone biosynthesis C-methylase UbiE